VLGDEVKLLAAVEVVKQ
jgi:hypothetical protein